ncbi:MAG: phosphatase PAP2 family protein [Silvibacterium sp.]
MAIADLIILAISVIGCKLTSIHIIIGNYLDVIFMACILLTLLFLYWDDKKRSPRLDSILVIPWVLLLIPLLAFPMLIAARLRMPLQDAHFARIDHLLGVNVLVIKIWASHHWLGKLINKTYPLLLLLLWAASLMPALTGNLDRAREFVVANLVAIAVGIPLFGLLPAVGPWSIYHFAPSAAQAYCQAQLFTLRLPGPYLFLGAPGVVCFPSFHVIWAIVCAFVLWDFRLLRIPVTMLSFMIILATMTTGWHYFSDVLGGVVVAGIAIAIAKAYTSGSSFCRQPSEAVVEEEASVKV